MERVRARMPGADAVTGPGHRPAVARATGRMKAVPDDLLGGASRPRPEARAAARRPRRRRRPPGGRGGAEAQRRPDRDRHAPGRADRRSRSGRPGGRLRPRRDRSPHPLELGPAGLLRRRARRALEGAGESGGRARGADATRDRTGVRSMARRPRRGRRLHRRECLDHRGDRARGDPCDRHRARYRDRLVGVPDGWRRRGQRTRSPIAASSPIRRRTSSPTSRSRAPTPTGR